MEATQDPMVGFLFAGIAVLSFGSNFVPVKKYETGDGIFFQWILCIGIFCTGFVVNAYRTFPRFEPFAMLGGVIWCLGNATAVPIIKCIGMGMGLLLWGMICLSTGWITSNFGLFGLNQKVVNHPMINYIGFSLTLVSAVLFSFVKSNVKPIEKNPLLETNDINEMLTPTQGMTESPGFFERMPQARKRVIGISLSVLAGFMYGSNFNPPQYLIDKKMGSDNGLDYVFSHFMGIIFTSTVLFINYCIIKGNKPILYPQVIIPGFLSGVIWAIGQISFFIANSNLPFVITFPIIGSGPGIIGALWGIIVFKEIKGQRNYLFFILATLVAGAGIMCIVLSNTKGEL